MVQIHISENKGEHGFADFNCVYFNEMFTEGNAMSASAAAGRNTARGCSPRAQPRN